MLKFNKEKLRDKIYACWVGKNMGGTLGAPYEGKPQMNDVKGFVTKPGEVLPNDDLDLQLVWLKAMEERGPDNVNAEVLGEYFLSYICPNVNEYGVCKSNLRAGLPAPLSGQYNNSRWHHSNGAWIRTEVWACLYPGNVEKTISYSYADASVDHGFGEGSYSAIFVAAMESAAFVFGDIETLIQIGLSKIPADCRVARSVRLVRDAYHSGKSWQETRELLVEENADLGWFQAPLNISFVIIGLLYGEGDFKKSMITAINCGDDTDCTAATVGSILGIIGGTAGLPADWVTHLGENIVHKYLLNAHGFYPKTITKLTDIVMDMLPITLHIPFYEAFKNPEDDTIVYDGPDDFADRKPEDYFGTAFVEKHFGRAPYCVMARATMFEGLVELDSKPEIEPCGSITATITLRLKGLPSQMHGYINWYLPEGWTVSGKKNLHIQFRDQYGEPCNVGTYTITAGEKVSASNHVVVEIQGEGRSESAFAAFNILG